MSEEQTYRITDRIGPYDIVYVPDSPHVGNWFVVDRRKGYQEQVFHTREEARAWVEAQTSAA